MTRPLRALILFALVLTTAASPDSLPKAAAGKRVQIVQHIGGIRVGAAFDRNLVAQYGSGLFVENEGHVGGRYFTNKAHSVTLHAELGVDACIEALELRDGLQIPGFTIDRVPPTAVSPALDKLPRVDHGVKLGMTAGKLPAILGPPTKDEHAGNRRTISYETDVDADKRVLLFYEAKYEFLNERLVNISMYDGE